MLLSSKTMMSIIAFYFFLQKVNLTNYISLKLTEVDDCVRLINISNKIVFNFSQQNHREHCDCNWQNKGPCDANNWWAYYAPDDFLIKDYEYEFMTGIEITFEDWNRLNGYMAIDIYLNEYIIKLSDQVFWECKNCYDENKVRGILLYEEDDVHKKGKDYRKKVLRFHPPNEPTEECDCGPDYYIFVFKIDDINDLYKGGQNGSFEMRTDFYTFLNEPQVKIEKEVNYSRNDIELELINFNLDDVIYSKTNPSLAFKNNDKDFIYKICVDDKEGQLEGLDTNGGNIANGGCFFETSGLNYTLGVIEKETNYTEIKLKISVFKKCPENTEIYKFCDRNTPIINEKDFIFQIKIIRPPEDTTAQTDTPTHSSKETETPSDSTKKSSNTEILDCLDHVFSHDDKNDIYSHLCPNFTTNEILDNMEDVINKIEGNKTYKIIGKDFVAQVVPIDYLDENNTINNNEIFSNSLHTNFTECEKNLRAHYKIESPRKITFIQVELNNTNDDILVHQIEYQVYDDNKTLLNLSLCNNTNLTVYYTLKEDKKEDVDLISEFKKNGIDILDINDKFFNDVCLPYSNSDNDMTLNDRIKDIYKNYSFCEKNCRLVDINFEEYKATCDCTIKENMNATDFNFNI